MSKVIRISEETFIRLQEHAEPLVDTPATVIERLLDFYERQRRRPENFRRGEVTRYMTDAMLSEPFGDFEYPPIVPSLFLAPASQEHVEATVERSVPYAKAERLILPRQRIQLKRAVEDASTFHCYGMSEGNRAVFESMRPGDYVLITVARSGQYNVLARIVTKFESEQLGKELWPDQQEEALSLIYAIEDVQSVTIDRAKLNKALGYSPRYSLKGAMRVDPKRLEPQLVRFGSVEGMLWDL
jgi:hypothetical protein